MVSLGEAEAVTEGSEAGIPRICSGPQVSPLRKPGRDLPRLFGAAAEVVVTGLRKVAMGWSGIGVQQEKLRKTKHQWRKFL